MSDGKLRELQQVFLSTRPHLHQFPVSGEVNTSEANLYTRARHHHGSLPSKLLKRQWFGVSPAARRVLLRGKGILLSPQDKPFYLQPWLSCWTCIQFCACWTPSGVNSIIHQETKPARGEGKGEISARLTRVGSAQKRLAQVIGRKQKIFRRKGG